MSQNTSHAVMAQRHEAHDSLDDFPTPPWATRALIEHVIMPPSGLDLRNMTVWEPACNRGFMAKPLAEYFGRVYRSDIHDYGWDGQEAVKDFLFPKSEFPVIAKQGIDWIITNPPFRLAAQFIARMDALRPRRGYAVLVRTSFLEGVDRYNTLFKVNPPAVVAQFVERVPMVKGRHDPEASTATSYAWLMWRTNWSEIVGPTTFTWIPPCRRQLQKPTDAEGTEMTASDDWQPMETAPHDSEFQLRGAFGNGSALIYPRARRAQNFDLEVYEFAGKWISLYGRSTVPFKALGWKPSPHHLHELQRDKPEKG